jgi:hypothetical protein
MLTLKVTKWVDLPENRMHMFIKDNDDNTLNIPTKIDILTLIDNNGAITTFSNCKFVARYQDNKDGDYLVHPYIYSYQNRT